MPLRESAFCKSPLGAFVKSPLGARGCDDGIFLGVTGGDIIKFGRLTGAHSDYITTDDLGTTLDFPTITGYARHTTKGVYVFYQGVISPSPTVHYKMALFDNDKVLQWTITEDQSVASSGSDYPITIDYALKANGDLTSLYTWVGSGTDPDPNIHLLRTYASVTGANSDSFVFTVKSGGNYLVGLPGDAFAYGASNLYGKYDAGTGRAKYDATGAALVKAYEFASDPYDAATSYDYTSIGVAPELAIKSRGLWTIDSDGVIFTMGAPRGYPNLDDTTEYSIFRYNASDSITHTKLLHASNTISAISLTIDKLYLYVHDGSTLYKLYASDLTTEWTASASGITQGTATDDGGVIVGKADGVAYYNADGTLKWSGASSALQISGRPFEIL